MRCVSNDKKMNEGFLSKSTSRGNVYHCTSRTILRYSAKTKGETIGVGVGPQWVLRKPWLVGIVTTEPPSAYASFFDQLLSNQIEKSPAVDNDVARQKQKKIRGGSRTSTGPTYEASQAQHCVH